MASVHVWKSIEVAAAKGGYAGDPATLPIWEMSKRELVEIALRLGEICSDEGGKSSAIARVKDERRILAEQGII